MLLNLIETLSTKELVQINETLTDVKLDTENLLGQVKSVDINGTVSKINKGNYAFTGNLKANILIPCSRCASDVDYEFDWDFSSEIVLDGQVDYPYICNKYNLDLVKFASVELIVNYPSKVLCSKDCKGLCPKCGANLNTTKCSCDIDSHMDIRMMQFKDLFETDFKEV